MDKCYVPNAFIVSYDLETVINTEQSSHSGTFVQREPRGTVFRFFSRDDRAGLPSSPKVANERPSGHVRLAEHGEVDKRRSGEVNGSVSLVRISRRFENEAHTHSVQKRG